MLPPTFTLKQAQLAGISKREIYRRRDAGEIELIRRGLFREADADVQDADLAEIAARTPVATLCLTTALARHELTDQIPISTDVAIPRGTRPPASDPTVQWHHFDAATFEIGRELLALSGKMQIGIYRAERCIIDAFRMRGLEGHEVAVVALKRWLCRRGSQPSKLLEMAKQFPRAVGPLQRTLEILL